MRAATYGCDKGSATAQAADEDVDAARLLHAAYDLASGDIGVGVVLQPGLVERKGAIVACGRVQAWKDMVLKD